MYQTDIISALHLESGNYLQLNQEIAMLLINNKYTSNREKMISLSATDSVHKYNKIKLIIL